MWVACLLIPHLPVHVEWRRNPTLKTAPLIIGGRRWDEGAVLDCCPQAVIAGVEPGMRLSRAEALCPQARFLPADEEVYDAVHQALIESARRFTPIVEADKLGLVYVDISGLRRRLDGDADVARRLIEKITSTSTLNVQIGVASGKFVAEQAARATRLGEVSVVPSGEERAFLSQLDISVLPLDPEMERRLRLLGVRTLGALAKLPRLAVLRQFGSSAGVVYDLACGVDARVVHANAPPLRLVRSHDFLEPVSDRAPLLAYVERMTDDLAEQLDGRGYQAEGLLLEVEESRSDKHAVGKPVKPPSSSAEQLSRLGARMLGGLTIREPVTSLSLTIYPLRPFHLGAVQLSLFNPKAVSSPTTRTTFGRALQETLRRLWDRFGELSVIVASLVVAPAPCPIRVTTGYDDLPRALVWRERIWEVRSIYEHWRERRCWWARPIERDYYRLEIEDGQMKVVFHDAQVGRWYMERRHI